VSFELPTIFYTSSFYGKAFRRKEQTHIVKQNLSNIVEISNSTSGEIVKSSEERKKVNKEIYEEVRKQLEPIFGDFYPTSAQYRTYHQARTQILERLTRVTAIMRALVEQIPLLQSKKMSPRFFCILQAITYLFYVELFGNYYVNLAMLLLAGKGHALHLEPDRKHGYIRHATSLKEIELATLSVKLDFLKSKGLDFFRKWIDTSLRNKIAHSDFDVDDNGNFFLVNAKGRRKKVDLMQKVKSFTDYYNAIGIAFAEYILGKTEEPKKQSNAHTV